MTIETTTPRRQPRAERTRLALIEAAANGICTHGVTASINDILDTAGCTKGAAYFHFDSRDSLLDAVSIEAAARWEAADASRGPDMANRVSRYVGLAATDPVVRADAIMWADPSHGSWGVYDELHARINDASDVNVADAVMTLLRGVGSVVGAHRGFAAPDAAGRVAQMLGVML